MSSGGVINCAECGIEMVKKSHNHKYCKGCRDEVTRRTALQEREESSRARYAIFLRDDFRCVYCGMSSIEDGVKLVLDHIMPYSAGGDNTIYNLATACFTCNTTKAANVLPIDVYERIVERNKKRNKGISASMQAEVNRIMDKYFTETKNK